MEMNALALVDPQLQRAKQLGQKLVLTFFLQISNQKLLLRKPKLAIITRWD